MRWIFIITIQLFSYCALACPLLCIYFFQLFRVRLSTQSLLLSGKISKLNLFTIILCFEISHKKQITINLFIIFDLTTNIQKQNIKKIEINPLNNIQSTTHLNKTTFVNILLLSINRSDCNKLRIRISTLTIQYSLYFNQQMRTILPLIFLVLIHSLTTTTHMNNLCSSEQTRKYIDISTVNIQKTNTFEYSLQLYDSPISIFQNKSLLTFRGNFSKLILKNRALKREFVYYGTEMILKIPADHVFSMDSIPDVQIQIIHSAQQILKINPYPFVLFSQMYMVSKFTNKIQTTLSKYLGKLTSDGDIIETNKIVKIIQGFPMLMYKGSPQSFPCRNDLLCLLKRQYQLISQEDYQQISQLLLSQGVAPKMKSIKRKNLYQIQQIPKAQRTSQNIQTQL